MRSGKSEWNNWCCSNVIQLYPKDYEIYIVDSNSLKFNLNHLEPCDVLICIVDDAIEFQSSSDFMTKANKLLAAKFYKIAHWYKKVTGKTKTFIITIFCAQRFNDLDPRFRAAHISIFQNTLGTPEENKFLKFILTPEDYNYLERATILRNFNLPQFSKYYVYYINKRYSGISEFPLVDFNTGKIDVQFTRTGSSETDLMLTIYHLIYEFWQRYKIKIRWDDIAKLVNWKGTSEGLRIMFKRWRDKTFQSYTKEFEEIACNNWYKKKLEKINK